MTTTQSIAWTSVSDVFVLVHADVPLADNDWQRYVTDLSRSARAVLVFTDGPGPNTAQRKLLAESTKSRPVPMAIVTESRIARAIVGLAALFMDGVKAFSPHELTRALEFLGVSEHQAALQLATSHAKASLQKSAAQDPHPHES